MRKSRNISNRGTTIVYFYPFVYMILCKLYVFMYVKKQTKQLGNKIRLNYIFFVNKTVNGGKKLHISPFCENNYFLFIVCSLHSCVCQEQHEIFTTCKFYSDTRLGNHKMKSKMSF